jgi:hypothetical protein
MEEFLDSFGAFRPAVQQFLNDQHLTDMKMILALALRPSAQVLSQECITRGLGEWESTFLAQRIFELCKSRSENFFHVYNF